MDDDYGSEWGDIDDQDLIAAADEAERQAPPLSLEQSGKNGVPHLRNNFGGLDKGELRNEAMSKVAPFTPPIHESRVGIFYPSLVNLKNTLGGVPVAEKDEKGRVVLQGAQRDGGGASKTPHKHVKGGRLGQ